MRYLRHLGLFVVLVASLAAFGASTASADRLCLSPVGRLSDPCTTSGGTVLLSGTRIGANLAPGTRAVLTTRGGLINPTITCTASSVTVTTTGDGGSGGSIDIPGGVGAGDVTFTSCTSTNPSGCSSTITNSNATTGAIRWTSGFDGTLSLTAPNFSVTCPPGIVCVFGGNVISGAFTHGTLGSTTAFPKVVFNTAINQSAGGSCPTMATWQATYAVTSVTPPGGSPVTSGRDFGLPSS